MALPKGFADWLASLAAASAQVGDQIPIVQGGVSKRVPAGQAGGIARIASDGVLAEPAGVLLTANATSHLTTEAVDDHELGAISVSRNGVVVVVAYGVVSRSNGSPRAALTIFKNGSRVSGYSLAYLDQEYTSMWVIVDAVNAAAGDRLAVHGGLYSYYADGTNEISIGTTYIRFVEFGGVS